MSFPTYQSAHRKCEKTKRVNDSKHIDAKNKINKKIARERENSRKFAHIRINKRLCPRIFRDRLSITGDQRVVGKSENRHRVLFILVLFSPPFYLFFRIGERLVVGEGRGIFLFIFLGSVSSRKIVAAFPAGASPFFVLWIFFE